MGSGFARKGRQDRPQVRHVDMAGLFFQPRLSGGGWLETREVQLVWEAHVVGKRDPRYGARAVRHGVASHLTWDS